MRREVVPSPPKRSNSSRSSCRATSALATPLFLLFFAACGDEGEPSPDAGTTHSDATVVADAGFPDAAEVVPDSGLPPEICVLAPENRDPDFVEDIGCRADYEAVAAPPIVASIPGALSAKTVIDQVDGDHLYFQNSRRYPIHWDFASTHVSGNGLPIVPGLAQFNQTEYYAPDRRFLLGALDYYEGPKVWAYEIAPYDTASAAQIEKAFRLIQDHLWAGETLAFHPTSDNVAAEAAKLPPSIRIVTTDELFEGIDYQPLNLASSMGQLRFFSAADLQTKYLGFRDIAVLEEIPNDLSACSGTITDQFQTPLSHINVLAQNRGTPNMGLHGAFTNPTLRALEGQWVELTVGASEWTIRVVTSTEADAWWEAHRPPPVMVPDPDLTVDQPTDVEDILEVDTLGLGPALRKAVPAFGGKASHFAAFPHIRSYPIPYPKAFVIPIHFYDQFMRANGFYDRITALRADASFRDDPAVREAALQLLRDDIQIAPIDPVLENLVIAKLRAEYPGMRMKFRSSTNCEDLNGFTGAGLYTSDAGDPDDPTRPVADAIRKVWSSVWRFRAYEEREYRGIPQDKVGMAVLVHRAFPAEDASGVAITANIFDTLGAEPGYYINAQVGDTSVVLPPAGVTSDQFLYHYDLPGQPIVFLAHSSLIPPGTTVLTREQTAELGRALAAIHDYFNPVYGPNTPDHFYAMDVEWKFNTDTSTTGPAVSKLVIKQARPYPGRGK